MTTLLDTLLAESPSLIDQGGQRVLVIAVEVPSDTAMDTARMAETYARAALTTATVDNLIHKARKARKAL